MLSGWPLIAVTNWQELQHAYGAADSVPGYLRKLSERDVDSQCIATDYLVGAILHQGSPFTATAPAALVVAGILHETQLDATGPATRVTLHRQPV